MGAEVGGNGGSLFSCDGWLLLLAHAGRYVTGTLGLNELVGSRRELMFCSGNKSQRLFTMFADDLRDLILVVLANPQCWAAPCSHATEHLWFMHALASDLI